MVGSGRPNLFAYAKKIRQGKEDWKQTIKRAQQELNAIHGPPKTAAKKKTTTAKKASTGTKKTVKRTTGVCKGREQSLCSGDPACKWIVPKDRKAHCRTRVGGVAPKTRTVGKCQGLFFDECSGDADCRWIGESRYFDKDGKQHVIKEHCSTK